MSSKINLIFQKKDPHKEHRMRLKMQQAEADLTEADLINEKRRRDAATSIEQQARREQFLQSINRQLEPRGEFRAEFEQPTFQAPSLGIGQQQIPSAPAPTFTQEPSRRATGKEEVAFRALAAGEIDLPAFQKMLAPPKTARETDAQRRTAFLRTAFDNLSAVGGNFADLSDWNKFTILGKDAFKDEIPTPLTGFQRETVAHWHELGEKDKLVQRNTFIKDHIKSRIDDWKLNLRTLPTLEEQNAATHPPLLAAKRRFFRLEAEKLFDLGDSSKATGTPEQDFADGLKKKFGSADKVDWETVAKRFPEFSVAKIKLLMSK